MKINDINYQNNRQINNFKNIISNLKNEISKKDEEMSIMSLNYDEQIKNIISENNRLQKY